MKDDVDIPEGHMYSPRKGKVRHFLFDWNNGRRNHYPICCILRFSIESFFSDGKVRPIEKGSGAKRGGFYRGPVEDDDVFVPCNIFHHKNHIWEE